jgi:hypothetical protein
MPVGGLVTVDTGILSVVVTPISARVSNGLVTSSNLNAYQNAAADFVFEMLDSQNNPVNLSGQNLLFTVHDISGNVLYSVSTGSGDIIVTGTNHNMVNLHIDASHNTVVYRHKWNLRNLTNSKMLQVGWISVLEAAID